MASMRWHSAREASSIHHPRYLTNPLAALPLPRTTVQYLMRYLRGGNAYSILALRTNLRLHSLQARIANSRTRNVITGKMPSSCFHTLPTTNQSDRVVRQYALVTMITRCGWMSQRTRRRSHSSAAAVHAVFTSCGDHSACSKSTLSARRLLTPSRPLSFKAWRRVERLEHRDSLIWVMGRYGVFSSAKRAGTPCVSNPARLCGHCLRGLRLRMAVQER